MMDLHCSGASVVVCFLLLALSVAEAQVTLTVSEVDDSLLLLECSTPCGYDDFFLVVNGVLSIRPIYSRNCNNAMIIATSHYSIHSVDTVLSFSCLAYEVGGGEPRYSDIVYYSSDPGLASPTNHPNFPTTRFLAPAPTTSPPTPTTGLPNIAPTTSIGPQDSATTTTTSPPNIATPTTTSPPDIASTTTTGPSDIAPTPTTTGPPDIAPTTTTGPPDQAPTTTTTSPPNIATPTTTSPPDIAFTTTTTGPPDQAATMRLPTIKIDSSPINLSVSRIDASTLLLSCTAPCGQYDDFFIDVNGEPMRPLFPGPGQDCDTLLTIATLNYELTTDTVHVLNFVCRAHELYGDQLQRYSDVVSYHHIAIHTNHPSSALTTSQPSSRSASTSPSDPNITASSGFSTIDAVSDLSQQSAHLAMLLELESSIEEKIHASENLSAIVNSMKAMEALALIEELDDTVDVLIVLYLLGDILNETNLNDSLDFAENFVDFGDDLSDFSVMKGEAAIVVASLLDIMDEVAFQVFPGNGHVITENIILQVSLVPIDERSFFTTINSSNFGSSQPEMSIQIPTDLVRMFEESDGRAVSYLYFNVEDLFPSLEEDLNSTLASGIISTALQCGSERCPTDNIELNSPVIISIHHSQAVTELLREGLTTQCVFWNFLRSGNTILHTGEWSDRGCVRNVSLSSISVTVCECYHLTHFALLLSAAPLNVEDVTMNPSLRVIDIVGVSISLVGMAATIITFIILKSLRNNMRNFIHINLCISLGIAYIIFVAGVDKSSGTDDVPAHCQAIAVLLHYFFLVSFMWMLMEGVVLYFILVKVFVNSNSRNYMLAFTISSYGIPLLYMGLLTLPLGFALPQANYGYQSVCFLNPASHFIWAFIAPVVVIFLLNTGLLIMTATILWRHKKRRVGKMRRKEIRNWLLALVSLVVIMGLTWVLGVVIVDTALLPLAYIYDVLVAFQGLWIFLLFVVLPKQVRDEYRKWWRACVNVKDSETSSKDLGKSKTHGIKLSMVKSAQSDTDKVRRNTAGSN